MGRARPTSSARARGGPGRRGDRRLEHLRRDHRRGPEGRPFRPRGQRLDEPFDPVNGTDDDGNGYVDDTNGWDFFRNDRPSTTPAPTNMARTSPDVGARGGNGIGVAGVNWRVTLISTKFLRAQGWLVGERDPCHRLHHRPQAPPRTGHRRDQQQLGRWRLRPVAPRCDRAGGRSGIVFVAAAGNTNTNNDAVPHYPSSYQCTQQNGQPRGWDCPVSVASITSTGARAAASRTTAPRASISGRQAARSSARSRVGADTTRSRARAWPPPT